MVVELEWAVTVLVLVSVLVSVLVEGGWDIILPLDTGRPRLLSLAWLSFICQFMPREMYSEG